LSLLDRIRSCNLRDMRHFRPFIVAEQRVGWIKAPFAARLAEFPEAFQVSDDAVRLAPGLASADARSAAVGRVTRALADEGVIQGWREEAYPVTPVWGRPALLRMERAAVPHFGVRAYGVHMNGFVRRGERLHMWVGRRAPAKHTFPDMLDNMVAGGQPDGVLLIDNLVKECDEEAAIPAALARRAVPTGAVSYAMETLEGLKPDLQFVYDLELPADFVPQNRDGEVAEFMLWPIERVASRVAETEDFKFNCNLVIIHFLVRHGLLPASEPERDAILRALRQ
jgi:hypothetical protein